MHSVALEYAQTALLVDLHVHQAVEGEKKSDQAAEDDVVDPFDCNCDAGGELIVFDSFLCILKAVGDVKHLIYVV